MQTSSNPDLTRTRRRHLSILCMFAIFAASLPAQDFSHPDTQPNPQAALVQQANDAIAAGDFPAALKVLTTLNTQTPNNPQILYDLGLTLEALQPPAPATSLVAAARQPATCNLQPATSSPTPEACYRAAIAADPQFPAAHVALGLLLARASRFAEARTQLLAAIQLPGLDPALAGRALRALARIDLNGFAAESSNTNSASAEDNTQPIAPNPPAASDDLLSALKLTPETPDDILLAAQIAEAAPDLPGAEQAYRRFLALTANDPQASDQATAALAHVLLREHHPADAEALLTPALAHSPGNPSSTAQLAEAYLASGDDAKIAQAVPLVESLHAKNPANASITRLLARVYIETGHPDQADPLYASLLSAQANHPDPTLLDDRAENLLLLHRPGEAEKLLKQAIADPSAFPSPAAFADAATHLAFQATANDDLHQSSQAAAFYKQFLAAANGSLPDQESQARRRLAELEHSK
jgi:Flp pilus assembly protein TadD